MSCRYLVRVTATVQELSDNLERIFAKAVTERPQSGLSRASSKKHSGGPAGDALSFSAFKLLAQCQSLRNTPCALTLALHATCAFRKLFLLRICLTVCSMSAIGEDQEDVEDAVYAEVQDSEADEGKREPQCIC